MQSCDYGRRFSELSALQQHQIAKIHCYCRECDRFFVHTDAVEQHRLSTVHNPPSKIKCIGGKRCKKQFTSPSAWLHHLESGACPPKMTREKLHSAVQSNDVIRLITGGSIQEYKALIGLDMSRTTSRTQSIIFTPITVDSFSGFPSPSDT